jgi:hypothetical protein
MVDIARSYGVGLRRQPAPSELAGLLEQSGRLSLVGLLGHLGRDELRNACKEHGVDHQSRARQELMKRLLKAHGDFQSVPPAPLFSRSENNRFDPRPGDTIRARHRQWLVNEVLAPPEPGQATHLKLTCLDDDHRGAELEVLWELELGAEVIHPESQLPSDIRALDDARAFCAYYNTIRWQGVTATESGRFQAPFRAGIRIQPYQLTPLAKALSLPRANLFIADDVGLGKTIEAGLVALELLLRQRVDFILIAAPASVGLQWQDEMNKRFGLHFEVFSRDFIIKKRRERGFGVNPWATHHRFIISYPLLRRPEYRDPLLQHIGERAKKSLLILDEAHSIAPASASKYALDSGITKVIRDIAPRFENRLFLSATPHNGHSNSFSALLEVLDPQRFSRGVPVDGPEALAPVMVRRLKSDLRQIMPAQTFTERKVVRIELSSEGKGRIRFANEEPFELPADAAELTDPKTELQLAELLSQYTELIKRMGAKKARRLSLVNLQKRLLSSPEAFARTLELHDKNQSKADASAAAHGDVQRMLEQDDAESAYGLDEENAEARYATDVETQAAHEPAPNDSPDLVQQAAALRQQMLAIARRLRRQPDMKVLALIAWLKRHCCPEITLKADSSDTPQPRARSKGRWTERRVIVFTEYTDTKRYLKALLSTAFEDTDRGDERLMEIHGGMNDQAREEAQYAFNSDPKTHPVRVLLCTDAAREGLNLQAHCADLFHFDIPWNPSRMEQRNGRIDRQLQPSPEVRCHYFIYPERKEDRVLETLVQKTETIRSELGSLGVVVLERMEQTLAQGIDAATPGQLELSTHLGPAEQISRRELEAARELDTLRREIDHANRVYEASRKVLDFRPDELRTTLETGLLLANLGAFKPTHDGAFELPAFPDDWQQTLDTLRRPKQRDESFYDWRKTPPRPVVFQAPDVLSQERVHLHLEHPFVKRVLSRFIAQGYAAHDLQRVTVIPMPDTAQAHVLVLGRLCLFGTGAGRLHDAIVPLAAVYSLSSGIHREPLDAAGTQALLKDMHGVLGRPSHKTISQDFERRLCKEAPRIFTALWPQLKDEADAAALDAEQKLTSRGAREADALRSILRRQKSAIEAVLGGSQLKLEFGQSESEQQQAKQREQDLAHLRRRLDGIASEMEREPQELAGLYAVKLRRLEPVGLVFLWPELEL